jgi:hypothetical protein
MKKAASTKSRTPKRRALVPKVPKARWVVVPQELLKQAMKDAEAAMQAGEDAMRAAEESMAASCQPTVLNKKAKSK